MLERIAILGGMLAIAVVAHGADLSADEKSHIDALLAHVADMKGADFIRNGKKYDASSAATFLRKKLQSQGSSVTNAASFIVQIATKSSTTGQPYRIRLADGTETDCGTYLAGVLAAMEKARPDPVRR